MEAWSEEAWSKFYARLEGQAFCFGSGYLGVTCAPESSQTNQQHSSSNSPAIMRHTHMAAAGFPSDMSSFSHASLPGPSYGPTPIQSHLPAYLRLPAGQSLPALLGLQMDQQQTATEEQLISCLGLPPYLQGSAYAAPDRCNLAMYHSFGRDNSLSPELPASGVQSHPAVRQYLGSCSPFLSCQHLQFAPGNYFAGSNGQTAATARRQSKGVHSPRASFRHRNYLTPWVGDCWPSSMLPVYEPPAKRSRVERGPAPVANSASYLSCNHEHEFVASPDPWSRKRYLSVALHRQRSLNSGNHGCYHARATPSPRLRLQHQPVPYLKPGARTQQSPSVLDACLLQELDEYIQQQQQKMSLLNAIQAAEDILALDSSPFPAIPPLSCPTPVPPYCAFVLQDPELLLQDALDASASNNPTPVLPSAPHFNPFSQLPQAQPFRCDPSSQWHDPSFKFVGRRTYRPKAQPSIAIKRPHSRSLPPAQLRNTYVPISNSHNPCNQVATLLSQHSGVRHELAASSSNCSPAQSCPNKLQCASPPPVFLTTLDFAAFCFKRLMFQMPTTLQLAMHCWHRLEANVLVQIAPLSNAAVKMEEKCYLGTCLLISAKLEERRKGRAGIHAIAAAVGAPASLIRDLELKVMVALDWSPYRDFAIKDERDALLSFF